MPNTNRWHMTHGRLFTAYGLAAVGLFVMSFGIGLGNAGVLAVGLAVAVLGPALLVVTAVRSNTREYIYGTAHVYSASPPPSSGMVGRCELHLSVFAHGIEGVAVRVLDPAVPVSKWPDSGATLPVEVLARNARKVRVLWDKVVTHAHAAGEDLYPDFVEDQPIEIDDDEHEHGMYPPDDYAAAGRPGTGYSAAGHPSDGYAAADYPSAEYAAADGYRDVGPAGDRYPDGYPPDDGSLPPVPPPSPFAPTAVPVAVVPTPTAATAATGPTITVPPKVPLRRPPGSRPPGSRPSPGRRPSPRPRPAADDLPPRDSGTVHDPGAARSSGTAREPVDGSPTGQAEPPRNPSPPDAASVPQRPESRPEPEDEVLSGTVESGWYPDTGRDVISGVIVEDPRPTTTDRSETDRMDIDRMAYRTLDVEPTHVSDARPRPATADDDPGRTAR